jgi:hypothetical protein
MATFAIQGGAKFETATPDEVRSIVADENERKRERLRGIKYMRLPVLRGTPASSALILGGASDKSNQLISPEMGDAWVIRHLWISGLATGTTPDLMNVLVNNQTWWQLNGNNFAYTFGKAEIILQQGESLTYQNSGNLAATGQITTGGAYWRVPGEMLAELY